MRKVIKFIVILGLLILISAPSFATGPYGVGYDYISANRPDLISQYSYWIFGQNQGIGFNDMTQIEHISYSSYPTASTVRPKPNVGALWVIGSDAYVLTSANWDEYMQAELNPNSPIGYKMIYTNVAITHQSSGFTTTPIDLFYDPYEGYLDYFTTTTENQLLSYYNSTDYPVALELWSNGTSNVSIIEPSKWAGTNDIGTSKILFNISPKERFSVQRNSGDLINIGIKDLPGEPFVYDPSSTVNILSPNNNITIIPKAIPITYRIRVSKGSVGFKAMMQINDQTPFKCNINDILFIKEIADDSTLLVSDKTYSKMQVFTPGTYVIKIWVQNLFGTKYDMKTLNITVKEFVDDGTGYDEETGEKEFDWSAPFEHATGGYNYSTGNLPEIKDIFNNLNESTGDLSSMMASFFTFMPPDLMSIIVFGIALVVLLRIVGR